ncbi:MAG: hypothetical protein JWN61_1446 [Pseudonocardiales bacterium]|nr:hypothetical protein [Pseudonocardiales bacterium]
MALVLSIASCTGSTAGDGSLAGSSAPGEIASDSPSPSPSGSSGSPSPDNSDSPNACPSKPIAPDAKRPVVDLKFDVAADLSTVQGSEKVVFTPDLAVDELVFRLTANTAPSVDEGNKVQVLSASADHGGQAPRYESADASDETQGGLLIIPLGKSVPAGTAITVDITFIVTLGLNSFDRFGRGGGFAWFASAHPLLAWERGVGWHTEPMLQFTAESATSEAADTTVSVTAPSNLKVLMSGNPLTGEPAGERTRWSGSLAAARDVSVSVGPFAVNDVSVDVGGSAPVALRVGAPTQAVADRLQTEFVRALTDLSAVLGPYPFPSLSVARLPGSGGGIEYPGAILMLDSSTLVVVHETAHQWFYAMVGNSQAEHAWLDEAFASWAEQVVDDDPPPASTLKQMGVVDTPTADYGSNENDYYFVTYDKGAAALHAASDAVGADKFESAIRCYINANAWTIADPENLEDALAGLPGAVAILQDAGALR